MTRHHHDTAQLQERLEQAAEIFSRARLPIALTGAGISVPSGIPDFRSPGGLWSRFDPGEVASVEALDRNPEGVWAFLLDAIRVMTAAEPNEAHEALAAMEARGAMHAVITQNIDGLHQRAGSKKVIEFHGSMARYHCHGCSREQDAGVAQKLGPADVPWRCGSCGGLVRPEVVFFGESIPPLALAESFRLAEEADAVLVAGTAGEVAPVNIIPQRIKARGGLLVDATLGSTHFDSLCDVKLDAPAEHSLPAMVRLLSGDGA
ncbi:MAG: SIR2 family NAD-dependent protein deacylase [Desulfovibrionaceae bacterium]